ncbi:LysE/ArgO family amino acid transporter [[Pseudomonas] boreopolis]|uniref:Transporter n=1 Tax=Xanthomonas boreopolis TaxID=86183 RepID=A0A919KHJ5_9XANT|nr:transporter [[Pseudomonas] boreopolis]
MSASYLTGLLTMASLIVALGAQNVYVLAQGLRREHHLAVAAFCTACDIVLVGAGVFGLSALIGSRPWLLALLRWGGVAFLVLYAAQALWRAWRPQALGTLAGAPRRSLRQALLAAAGVSLLNPHVYLDTLLLVGSIGAREDAPAAFALGASTTSTLWFFGLSTGAARLAPWLARPRVWRVLDVLVAGVMLWVAWRLASAG